MTSILRWYEQEECDSSGVPLDWERCRACEGSGKNPKRDGSHGAACAVCAGHGSLKAAALAELLARPTSEPVGDDRDRRTFSGWRQEWIASRTPIRCEDCGHPMSEGTWEGELSLCDCGHRRYAHSRTNLSGGDNPVRGTVCNSCSCAAYVPSTTVEDPGDLLRGAHTFLAAGHEPPLRAVHYSPCDEGCRHQGPVRAQMYPGLDDPPPPRPIHFGETEYQNAGVWTRYMPVEASWRPVDVRRLGWPHDLRPERLAVLCLRCWASRS